MLGNFARIAEGAPPPIVTPMRALAWALGWLLGYYLLAKYGVYLLPSSVARATTLPEYLAMVQIVSVLLGVGALLFATRRDLALRRTYFPELSREYEFKFSHGMFWAFLGPLTFLTAYGVGMYLAFDTLLQELATRGAGAVQAETGELGKAARVDSLFAIIPFTVLLAPLGEELLFRGGIYGGIQAWFNARVAVPSQVDVPPSFIATAGLPRQVRFGATSWGRWLFGGGFALLGSSLCFGLMHADTAGGMGIVRVVSASTLGLACGLARTASGTLLAPFVLHASYNLLSLASLRGWLVFEGFPTKYTIPTSLGPLSVLGVAGALGLYLASRRARNNRNTT